MTPIRRGKQGIYFLYVPKQKGGVVLRTTGTVDKRTYTLMKALVARLKAERRWPLLMAVVTKRVWLGQLYDADRTNSLDALEAGLSAQELSPLASDYLAACEGRGLAERNVENIKRQLDAFLWWLHAKGLAETTADLTSPNVTAWLASLKTTPGTRRQYLYAVTGFTRYLVDEVEVLKDYPLGKVKAPKKNQPRMTYVDAATDERIVQAASPQYRALFAFIKATGCDLTTALNLRRGDVSNEWTARLKGTKTANRDVHFGIIEPWAWGYLRPTLQATLGNAKVFPGLGRSGAYHHHARCCTALELADYTLKDSRHSVAVRMAKAGYTAFEIAEQLGTSVDLVSKVYAQFIVKMAHRVTAHVTEAAK